MRTHRQREITQAWPGTELHSARSCRHLDRHRASQGKAVQAYGQAQRLTVRGRAGIGQEQRSTGQGRAGTGSGT